MSTPSTIKIVDTKHEASTVTLPRLGTLNVGVTLNGVPAELLKSKLQESYADRFLVEAVEAVAEEPAPAKKTTRGRKSTNGVQNNN